MTQWNGTREIMRCVRCIFVNLPSLQRGWAQYGTRGTIIPSLLTMREVVDRLPGVQPELPAQWHPPPKPSYVLFMAHENLLVSTRIW